MEIVLFYYRFHIGDYKRATDHLTNGEDLAYRRLLDMYYETEKPIPMDTQWVARRLRVDLQDVDVVLDEFFSKTEAGFVHQYCENQIAAYHKRSDANKTNGSKGGRRKKQNPMGSDLLTHSVANGNPDETHRASLTNNHKPITNINKKEIEKPEGVCDTVWADFVQHRKAKKAAITQTAIKGIEREANKAGISLSDALQEICARGWTGFKADWMKNGSHASTTTDDMVTNWQRYV